MHDGYGGTFHGLPIVTNRFASIGVTVCGIVLAVVPLALWVAWSPNAFLLILVVCAVSVVLLGILVKRLPPRNDGTDGQQDDDMKSVLPDGFVEEIHKIYPLTYHHSRIGRARFRRAMDRLRQMIR